MLLCSKVTPFLWRGWFVVLGVFVFCWREHVCGGVEAASVVPGVYP